MKTTAGRQRIYLLIALLTHAVSAGAHEFWIEPLRFVVPPDGRIVANLNVGQFFKGNVQAFIPERFVELSVTDSSGKREISGRLGDIPAIDQPVLNPGIQVLAYQSRPQSAVYEDFNKFERFALKEGNGWLVDAHRLRGLSRRKVTEAYTRYAKSLVLAGGADGADAVVGFPLEFVIEFDPYARDLADALPVRLLRDGAGLPSAQIKIFSKLPGCEATRATVVTDDSGRALVPRGTGGRFLLNAVHVIEPTKATLEDIDADWESLWASITFELPVDAVPESDSAACAAEADTRDK